MAERAAKASDDAAERPTEGIVERAAEASGGIADRTTEASDGIADRTTEASDGIAEGAAEASDGVVNGAAGRAADTSDDRGTSAPERAAWTLAEARIPLLARRGPMMRAAMLKVLLVPLS